MSGSALPDRPIIGLTNIYYLYFTPCAQLIYLAPIKIKGKDFTDEVTLTMQVDMYQGARITCRRLECHFETAVSSI